MSSTLKTGYCTNIHAGTDLRSLRENLRRYSAEVRHLARPDESLGVGLWVPAQAAQQLVEKPEEIDSLAALLAELRLEPYTFNGFPYGNFHDAVVKHRVYLPDWGDTARLRYTRNLVAILDRLLPQGAVGSISTLPLAWGKEQPDLAAQAATELSTIASELAALESASGRRIVLAIEPEPGCMLDRADDVIAFFASSVAPEHRRYLTVCHDICHSAVMFESQAEVLGRYAAAGIVIGKVQVSSAIRVPWQRMDEEQMLAALRQLQGFAEDRYLHQTGRCEASGEFSLVEDLPQLLASLQADGAIDQSVPHLPIGTGGPAGDRAWCIHFHVPIFLDRFGVLEGTQDDIVSCLTTLLSSDSSGWIPHFEIETYAWGVLPSTMRQMSLAQSIAGEVQWLDRFLHDLRLDP